MIRLAVMHALARIAAALVPRDKDPAVLAPGEVTLTDDPNVVTVTPEIAESFIAALAILGDHRPLTPADLWPEPPEGQPARTEGG